MSASTSRVRKRHLAAVQQRVDKITLGDAMFFKRFPYRSHRVRLASTAELEQNTLVTGVADPTPAAGHRYFVAVRQVAPGFRLRLFAESFDDADVDMSESEAKQVFDFVARSHDQANAFRLREAATKREARG